MTKTKKWLLAFMGFTAALTLAACGSSASQPDKLAQIKDSGKLVIGTSPDFPPMEFYILNEKGEKETFKFIKSVNKKEGLHLPEPEQANK